MSAKVRVRMATDADGPRIGELGVAQGLALDGIDWSEVAPYWLVAETESGVWGAGPGEAMIVGALQLCLAKPFGRLEMLYLDGALTQRQRARVGKALVGGGLLALKVFGAQFALAQVPHTLPEYKRLLKRRGAVTLSSGNMMAKRL